jgi:hypothetical protein
MPELIACFSTQLLSRADGEGPRTCNAGRLAPCNEDGTSYPGLGSSSPVWEGLQQVWEGLLPLPRETPRKSMGLHSQNPSQTSRKQAENAHFFPNFPQPNNWPYKPTNPTRFEAN